MTDPTTQRTAAAEVHAAKNLLNTAIQRARQAGVAVDVDVQRLQFSSLMNVSRDEIVSISTTCSIEIPEGE